MAHRTTPSAAGRRALVAAALALAGVAAQAQQTTLWQLGPTEAMVSACAGLQTGNGWAPGSAVGMIGARSDCQSVTTTQPATVVGRSVDYDESPVEVAASSEGQAQLGQLRLASRFESDTANGLTIGVVNAGWNAAQTVVPVDPTLLGQLALYSFGIHVHGTLDGASFGNSGVGFSMLALRDNGFYGSNWSSVRITPAGQAFHRDLDEIVTMSVPVVLGSEFTLGFFAATWSGNSSGFGGASTASSDLLGTVTWMGVSSVTLGGNPIDFSVQSPDGIDWSQPFVAASVPEPAGAWMALTGVGVLLAARRARRR